MDEQPTLVDDTKTPEEDLTKEGDELYKRRQYKEAAKKYQEAVDRGYGEAMYKLADMIYNNTGNLMTEDNGYNFKYAVTLYTMARNAGYPINEEKLRDIVDHYRRYRRSYLTTSSGGYKKRKSNRKHPSKRNRNRKHKWSLKYKRSIDCNHPKGFSQRQHCKYGRKTMRKSRSKK